MARSEIQGVLKPAPTTLGRYRQRQEAQTCEASLGHIARLCLKTKQKRKKRRKEKKKGKGRERMREGKRQEGVKVWRTLKFVCPPYPCSQLESWPEGEAVSPWNQPGAPMVS